MSFALKLLDGKTRGELKHFVPKLIEPLRLCKKRTRQTLEGTQVAPKVRPNSLGVYKRGFVCALPEIWSRIPIEIINKGATKGWLKIKNACSDFLTGKSKTAYVCVCHREGSMRAVYARTRRPLAVSLRNTVS